MEEKIEDKILRSLRRLSRAIDIHSRKLANNFGLTGPQLVCLRALERLGSTTAGALAKEVSLSSGTVTGILDRLLGRQLIQRERGSSDRRQVLVTLSEAGRTLIRNAPSPLQEKFVEKLLALPDDEQKKLLESLNVLVEMMGAEQLEAEPLLTTTAVAQSTEELQDVIAEGDIEVSASAAAARELTK